MSSLLYRLTEPQAKILSSKKRFVVVNAGRRFGKTWVSGVRIADKSINNSKKVVIYVAPTADMCRNLMWDTWLKEHIPDEYIVKRNEQLMQLTLLNGSRIYCFSADKPDRLRGLAADLLVVDECADIDNSFYDIVRPVLADKYHDGEALYISTPKGYNWFYDRYCDAKKHPATWDIFQFTTLEGGNVTPEEIEEMKKDMTPKMVQQELYASFECVSNKVYEMYDKVLNSCVRDPMWKYGDIHVGMDFNVNPMTAVIGKFERGFLYIFDEIVDSGSNTQQMCNLIKKAYPDTTVFVYPDPTGNKQQTNAPIGQTDMTILAKNGFIVQAPYAPYASKDKWNTVNTALCDGNKERHVFIDYENCPHVEKAFNGYTFKPDGKPDKSSGLDHISDAAAYLICYLLPYFSNERIAKPRVLGV